MFLKPSEQVEINITCLKYISVSNNETDNNKIQDILAQQDYRTLYDMMLHPLRYKTEGICGLMLPGFSYINEVTINMICTAFISMYHDSYHIMKKKINLSKVTTFKVFIGFDIRHKSFEFAKIAANVFYNNDFMVYMHFEPIITPMISTMVCKFYCHIGVMITGGHTNAKYNGIKFYLDSGHQLPTQYGDIMNKKLDEMKVMPHYKKFVLEPLNPSSMLPYYSITCASWCAAYPRFLCSAPTRSGRRVMFSGLYGPGTSVFKHMLELNSLTGLVNFYAPHCVVDPNLGGAPTLNPDNEALYTNIYKVAEDAHIAHIIMVDPSGTRVGYAEQVNGVWRRFTSDEIAAIILYYTRLHNDMSEVLLVNSYYCNDTMALMALKCGAIYSSVDTGSNNLGKAAFDIKRILGPFKVRNMVAYDDMHGFMMGDQKEKDAISVALAFTAYIQNELPSFTLKRMGWEFGIFEIATLEIRIPNHYNVFEELLGKLGSKGVKYTVRGNCHKVDFDSWYILFRPCESESVIKVFGYTRKMDREKVDSVFYEFITNVMEFSKT